MSVVRIGTRQPAGHFGPDQPRLDVFLSIGISEWSPFDIVFRTLDWKDYKVNALGNLVLEALDVVIDILDLISTLPLAQNAVALRFYRLHSSNRQIRLDGRTVELEAVSEEILIQPRGTKRRTRAEIQDDWNNALDELSGDASSDTEHGIAGGAGSDVASDAMDIGALIDGAPPRSIDGSGDSVLGGSHHSSADPEDEVDIVMEDLSLADPVPEPDPGPGDGDPDMREAEQALDDAEKDDASVSSGSSSSGRPGTPSSSTSKPDSGPIELTDAEDENPEIAALIAAFREDGRLTMRVPGGIITWAGDEFVAHCTREGHKRKGKACERRRSSDPYYPPCEMTRPAQGRPLAALVLWLQIGADCLDGYSHVHCPPFCSTTIVWLRGTTSQRSASIRNS